MTRNNVLTPRGVARLLGRGLRANFAPENQQAEAERLIEYLQDMAVSRAMEAELPDTIPQDAAQAQRDAAWLDAIAGHLEEVAIPDQPQNQE